MNTARPRTHLPVRGHNSPGPRHHSRNAVPVFSEKGMAVSKEELATCLVQLPWQDMDYFAKSLDFALAGMPEDEQMCPRFVAQAVIGVAEEILAKAEQTKPHGEPTGKE